MKTWLGLGLAIMIGILVLAANQQADRDAKSVGIAACLFLLVGALRLMKGVET